MASQVALSKESGCQCRRFRKRGFSLWIEKIPWRRKWQPAPVFLAEKSHGGAWCASVHGVAKSWTQLNEWALMCMTWEDSHAHGLEDLELLKLVWFLPRPLSLTCRCPSPHCPLPWPVLWENTSRTSLSSDVDISPSVLGPHLISLVLT